MPLNRAWFQERLKTLGISQRQLAKRIGLDPAAVSYMLAGKRTMSMDEAKAIADIFLLPVTEVMRQAGIDVLDDIRKIPIAGYCTSDCSITMMPKGTHDMIVAPADVPSGSFAIQHRSVNSIFDGWISFISGAHEKPDDCIGKLTLLALKDGRLLRGVIKRGYKQTLYNLVLVPDGTVLENQEVAWAARVLWILPT
jgi:DNA-binding XRE family transcriptional regulator